MEPFDEEAAARAVAELAATADSTLVVAIRETTETFWAIWEAWRANPSYPGRSDPNRSLWDGLERAAQQAIEAIRAQGPDDHLDGAVRAVQPVLSAYWPTSPAAARPVAEAVEAVRCQAMSRTQLVRDARRIAYGGKP